MALISAVEPSPKDIALGYTFTLSTPCTLPTVTVQVPDFVVSATLVAVITTVPAVFAVNTPVLDTSATAVSLDVHVTSLLANPTVSTSALNT